MVSENRGWCILDGEVYIISSLEDSDCYEAGTRYVSLNLICMEGVDSDEG